MEKRDIEPADGGEYSVARAMLVLRQYRQLCEIADGICRIVPLKGVSLLQSLYSQLLDRDAGDIDILVFPASKAPAFIEKLIDAGYERQFDHLSDSSALDAKRKIALRGRDALETDVDIHLSFITKRIFRSHCGNFNDDALSRCVPTGPVESVMDRVDEWLFLAHHACFHQFENAKWSRDLELMLSGFTPQEVHRLKNRARKYGMMRVARVCERELNRLSGRKGGVFSLPLSTGGDKRFELLTDGILHKPHSRIMRRVFRAVWEIIFIDSPAGRLKGCCQLLFPSKRELKAVYRTSSSVAVELLRIPHLFFAGIALSLFQCYSLFVSPFLRKAGE